MTDDLVKRLRNGDEFERVMSAEQAAARIEELTSERDALQAKLAKATEALGEVQDFVRELEPYADQGHTLVPALRKACETLNELKDTDDDCD